MTSANVPILNIYIFTIGEVYIYYRYRDVTLFVTLGEEEKDSNCDISTTVTDINCSYSEN